MAADLTEGPAMQALTEFQQKFVLAMCANPFGKQSQWAAAAGYSETGNTAAVVGYKLVRDPKIQLAVREVSLASANTLGPPMGFKTLMDVASDEKHKDRVKAAQILLDRVGMGAIQKIDVTHHDMTGDALIARIRELAQKHGLDEAKLIGSNAIDGEYEVVQQSVRGEGQSEHGQLLQEGRQGDGGGAVECDDGGGAQA